MKIEKIEHPVKIPKHPNEKNPREFEEITNCPIVRFDSHQRPFLLREFCCDSPLCQCRGLDLEFYEIDEEGGTIDNPIIFAFTLDVDNWSEINPSPRPAASQQLVDEFIANLGENLKKVFKNDFEKVKERVREAAKNTIPLAEIKRSSLFPFCEVLEKNEKGLVNIRDKGSLFKYKDKSIYTEDLFCANPECDCMCVHLVFLDITKKEVSYLFMADYYLNNGEVKIKDDAQCSKKLAKNIFSHWKQNNPSNFDALQERYDKMKEEGKKIFQDD